MKSYANGRARRKSAKRQRQKLRKAWRAAPLWRKLRFALVLLVRHIMQRAAEHDAARAGDAK